MPRRPWIVVLAAVALGGCGGEPTLSAGSADDLHGQVAAAREAASKGDRTGALEALDGLEADVRDLQNGGSLTKADADALRRGIGRARRRVRADAAEATPTAEPTATPTPTPTPTATAAPPKAKPAKPPKDNGKGKGKKEKDE